MDSPLPESGGEAWFVLIFVAITIVLATVGGVYAYVSFGRSNACNLKSLQEKGYVVQHAYQKDRGYVTRVWAPFKEPKPLYVNISNRDPVEVMAGRMGIKDIMIGCADFDQSFVIRSNRPVQVKPILTPELQKRFMAFDDIAFVTGSNESLVFAEFPDESTDEARLRKYWRVLTKGELNEEAARPNLVLGQEVARQVELLCIQQSAANMDELFTATFEGR